MMPQCRHGMVTLYKPAVPNCTVLVMARKEEEEEKPATQTCLDLFLVEIHCNTMSSLQNNRT